MALDRDWESGKVYQNGTQAQQTSRRKEFIALPPKCEGVAVKIFLGLEYVPGNQVPAKGIRMFQASRD